MKFTKDPITANTVQKVDRGSVQVGDTLYTSNIGLLTHKVVDLWPERAVADLEIAYLEPILESLPEMVLLGSGWQHQFAPRELTFALARRGIGLEVMDTAAACRTFNILVGEGRLPAAILYVSE